MSTAHLEQAIASTRSVLENVSADQMQAATPCASWNVSQLINHMVGGPQFFAAFANGQAPSSEETDWSAGDYLASFDAACGDFVAGMQQEGAMEKMFELPFGTMPGAAFAGLATNDIFTHGWDLAKATGQSTDLAPELAAGILAQSRKSIQESFRGEDGDSPFGAEQHCADGACNADQLAAFLGRQV